MPACSTCGRDGDFWCRRCEIPIALPANADHFYVLGIRPGLHLDTALLGDRMVLRTRRVHPDRWQNATPELRERALAWASAINNAYRVLREPYLRARYWLERNGAPLAEQTDSVPPALAAELFEAREALEAWRGAPDDATAQADLDAARAWTESALTHSLAELRRLFHQHDLAGSRSEAAIPLSDLRREAGLCRMLMKLRDDLNAAA